MKKLLLILALAAHLIAPASAQQIPIVQANGTTKTFAPSGAFTIGYSGTTAFGSASMTSWAAVTRASGFDTFTATPSSANLLSLLTTKTGTGNAVFSISPTFTGTAAFANLTASASAASPIIGAGLTGSASGEIDLFGSGGGSLVSLFAKGTAANGSIVIDAGTNTFEFANGTARITVPSGVAGNLGTMAFLANTGSSTITTVGTVTSGTWSGSFGAVSGANLTTLNATNISSGTLGDARNTVSNTTTTSFIPATSGQFGIGVVQGSVPASNYVGIKAPTGFANRTISLDDPTNSGFSLKVAGTEYWLASGNSSALYFFDVQGGGASALRIVAGGAVLVGNNFSGIKKMDVNGSFGVGDGGGTTYYLAADSGGVTQSVKTTNYNGISTAGNGLVSIVKATRVTAQSAANASICTYTAPAADGSYEVSANMNVTAATVLSTTLSCTYTDESNTSRTMIFPIQQLTGSFIAGGLITGTGAWESPVMHIRCKASTAITIFTAAGTFNTVTYTAEGIIKQTQ